jgi:AcrR family transcriptional regulator
MVTGRSPHDERPTSDRLVTTTATLFRVQGYARTTTRQLGEALGIRGASIYHHITSKEELLHEICIRSPTDISVAVDLSHAPTPLPGASAFTR